MDMEIPTTTTQPPSSTPNPNPQSQSPQTTEHSSTSPPPPPPPHTTSQQHTTLPTSDTHNPSQTSDSDTHNPSQTSDSDTHNPSQTSDSDTHNPSQTSDSHNPSQTSDSDTHNPSQTPDVENVTVTNASSQIFDETQTIETHPENLSSIPSQLPPSETPSSPQQQLLLLQPPHSSISPIIPQDVALHLTQNLVSAVTQNLVSALTQNLASAISQNISQNVDVSVNPATAVPEILVRVVHEHRLPEIQTVPEVQAVQAVPAPEAKLMTIRSNQRNRIRVVVAGDTATGKSSLIVTAISQKFPTKVPPVLPPNHISADVLLNQIYFSDVLLNNLPITIIDTPSGPEHSSKREQEFRLADVVVLTFARDRFDTFENLKSYWLPELRRLKLNVPVVVAGCKADLRVDTPQISIEQYVEAVSLIQKEFPEIVTRTDSSASKYLKVPGVFIHALRHIVYPAAPLFDLKTQTLTPQCLNGLKRIFLLCDLDRDGALNDAELNEFQVKSFNVPLKPSEIVALKRAVQDKLPEGVNERGLTLKGFLFHHEYVTLKTGLDLIWIILRKFGYNDDVRLVDDFLPPFKRAPDQSMELTNVALDFLREIFSMYYKNNDGVICAGDVEHLFSTAPDCPWSESPYMGAASTNVLGGLTRDGFLSEWVLMTLLEPAKSVEYLKYIMYDGDVASAIRLTRKRLTDRKKRQSERTVYQCFVFGPKKAGKTALLDGFLGRPFSDTSIPNTEERYAVNVVDGTPGSQKFLVLREIPEAKVKNLLSDKESLAACDVALFVYDSTDESSFTKTAKLLAEVARHGEDTGYEVPFMIVSAKDDLNSYTKSIKDSTRLSQDMGIDAPVPVSAKRGDYCDIFQRIVTTAEQPHLNIPETEAGRSRKQYLRLVNPSFIVDSAGAAGCHYRIGCLSCLFYVFLGQE